MYFNFCWSNQSQSSEDSTCIPTCVHQTNPLPERTEIYLKISWPNQLLAKTQHVYLNLCWSNHSHACEETMYLNLWWTIPYHACEEIKSISKCVDKTHPMPARTLNVSQLVLINPLSCRWGNKCISTCDQQTPPMPTSIQNASQQNAPPQGNKISPKMCCPNPSEASEYTKWTSTWFDQTPPMPAKK